MYFLVNIIPSCRFFMLNNTFKFHGYDLYCIDRKGKLSLTRKNKETDANKIHAAVSTLNIVYTNTVMWCYVLLFDTIDVIRGWNRYPVSYKLNLVEYYFMTKPSFIINTVIKTTEGSKIVSMVITGSSLDYNCILIARIIFLLIPLTILDVCAAWY